MKLSIDASALLTLPPSVVIGLALSALRRAQEASCFDGSSEDDDFRVHGSCARYEALVDAEVEFAIRCLESLKTIQVGTP